MVKQNSWLTLVISVSAILAVCFLLIQSPTAATQNAQANLLILQRLREIEQLPRNDPRVGYSGLWNELDSSVGQLSSPCELKSLFYAALHEARRVVRSQHELQRPNAYFEACECVLFRLAALDTNESTQTLVQIFADETVGFDAAFAVSVCNAISRCGRRAIPYLESVASPRWRSTIPILISEIRAGRLYGP